MKSPKMPINNSTRLQDYDSCRVNEPHLEDRAKESFRVRVFLQPYFSDERSHAYVNVFRHRPVRWLQQRLKILFGIKEPFFLCSSGYFLPTDELLSILQPNDPVEVIPISKDFSNSGDAISSKTDLQSNESSNSQSVMDSYLTPNCFTETVDIAVVGLEEERDDALLCMKQQALALLETCCEETASAKFDSGQAALNATDVDKPRRSRRRVRRRKRHLSVGESNGEAMVINKETVKDIVKPSFQNSMGASDEKGESVADLVNVVEGVDRALERDNLMDTRKARLVRSVSPLRT